MVIASSACKVGVLFTNDPSIKIETSGVYHKETMYRALRKSRGTCELLVINMKAK